MQSYNQFQESFILLFLTALNQKAKRSAKIVFNHNYLIVNDISYHLRLKHNRVHTENSFIWFDTLFVHRDSCTSNIITILTYRYRYFCNPEFCASYFCINRFCILQNRMSLTLNFVVRYMKGIWRLFIKIKIAVSNPLKFKDIQGGKGL